MRPVSVELEKDNVLRTRDPSDVGHPGETCGPIGEKISGQLESHVTDS
jgi:hypothetical protein